MVHALPLFRTICVFVEPSHGCRCPRLPTGRLLETNSPTLLQADARCRSCRSLGVQIAVCHSVYLACRREIPLDSEAGVQHLGKAAPSVDSCRPRCQVLWRPDRLLGHDENTVQRPEDHSPGQYSVSTVRRTQDSGENAQQQSHSTGRSRTCPLFRCKRSLRCRVSTSYRKSRIRVYGLFVHSYAVRR